MKNASIATVHMSRLILSVMKAVLNYTGLLQLQNGISLAGVSNKDLDDDTMRREASPSSPVYPTFDMKDSAAWK